MQASMSTTLMPRNPGNIGFGKQLLSEDLNESERHTTLTFLSAFSDL